MTSQGHQNIEGGGIVEAAKAADAAKEVRAADEARTLEQARSAEAAMAGEGRSHEAGSLGVGTGCDLGLLFVRRREEQTTEERALLGRAPIHYDKPKLQSEAVKYGVEFD
uniref:Uncharacterized protein n=1 Tax=Oryza glumipatula TaxID=40148 RepID=A0A0D9Z5T3_9ORYZ